MIAVLCSLALPAQAAAASGGWLGPIGVVNANTVGNEAQVSASTQVLTGGAQVQVPSGDDVGGGGGASGPNPWAKYPLVTDAAGGQQLCLTVNAGLPGGSDRVQVCYDVALPGPVVDGAVTVDPAVLAAQAVARLSVPPPSIVVSPHPSDNQWGVSAVGLPLWVWADDPGPVNSTVTEQGIDIVLRASRGSVRFDWGDGTSSVCDQMRPRPVNVGPLVSSPDRGHTFVRRGDYTITATAGWAVSWQALGQSGTLPLSSSATMSIPVREFQSLVVG